MEKIYTDFIYPELMGMDLSNTKNSVRIKKISFDVLCCPRCRKGLSPLENSSVAGNSEEGILCSKCHKKFLNTNGYIDFLPDNVWPHSSRRERIIRTLLAKMYTPANNFMFLFCGGARNARMEVLSQLDLKDNAVVLETGMGAGENYLLMNKFAKNLRFFGIDIQKQMMTHCTRNIKQWELDVELFRADAVDLPFRDEKFDVVFHLGAFNLFSNKLKAIEEMIRVAKAGASIVIADETEKAGRLFNLFTGAHEKIVPPIDIIPRDMLNKKMEIIWQGFGYLIKFTKPPDRKSSIRTEDKQHDAKRICI
jgi:ubiquinone/menaquinone biosynthesis C-methylase UbiE